VQLDVPLGAIALLERGRLVAASGRSILLLGSDGQVDGQPIEIDRGGGIRFNDGAVDPAGRFLVGTTAADGRRRTGALHSIDLSGDVRVVIDGVTESNGVGWLPDPRTMYEVGSGEPVVRAYEYDGETGNLRRSSDLFTVGSGV